MCILDQFSEHPVFFIPIFVRIFKGDFCIFLITENKYGSHPAGTEAVETDK